jgi:osmotically-inducible protein OsmY
VPGMSGATLRRMDESEHILDEVRRVLSERGYVSIEAELWEGAIILEGDVPGDATRRRVEEVVSQVPGVKGVDNRLRVRRRA